MSNLARRAITIPLYFLLLGLSLAALPFMLPLTAVADLVLGTPFGISRSLLFFTWYLGCECVGLIAAAALWLANQLVRPGHERYLAWNFTLKCWWARQLLRGARWFFGLRFEVEGAEHAVPGPVFAFMRHASTADTMLTTAILSDPLRMEFRHVIKRELLWDPCLDVAGQRLNNYFVDRNSEDSAQEIAGVAALGRDLGADEGVLIYPEGTRFTEAKRRRILERLEQKGEQDLLVRARALKHVLPPRLGGPLGLLDAHPGVDVLFCAHVGFDGIQSFMEFLRGGLVGQTVRMAYWRVPAAEIPVDRDARIDWLFEHWGRVDRWVAAHAKVR